MKMFFNKKVIGLVIGLVFIILIVKNIDINKSIDAVKQLNFLYVFLMIPAYFCSFWFRSLRWKAILSEKKEIAMSFLLASLLRGWMINCVVPARGGEIYRAHFFGKKEKISRMTILASIVLERVFDGIILFLILLSLVCLVYSSQKFLNVAIMAGIIFVGCFTGLLLSLKFYKNVFVQEKFLQFRKIIPNFLNKLLNRISYFVNSFINGLEIFEHPSLILKSFFFSVLVWFFEAITLFFLIKGFGCSLGLLEALFVLSIVAFASLIPGGPASLGPVQWGFIIALGFFKTPQEIAFAVSIINQLFMTLFVSLGSLIFIIKENLSLKEQPVEISSEI